MFIEPRTHNDKRGWIEVICGSMFSGKTEELIRRLKRAQYAGMKVEIFKPEVDTRYDEEKIVSHDNNEIHSTPITSSQNIPILATSLEVIGIDEAQFFDNGIIEVAQNLALKGARVIVAGLDMDYLGRPFGPMPQLLAVAEYVTKLHAICMHCGSLANHSFRKVEDDNQFFLGEKTTYEPLCRNCYNQALKEKVKSV
ncbi:MAG: thymidine kinase [Saprospiraceae bacterium]|nr:thymidine kinase [Saprospiraceae bacterium]